MTDGVIGLKSSSLPSKHSCNWQDKLPYSPYLVYIAFSSADADDNLTTSFTLTISRAGHHVQPRRQRYWIGPPTNPSSNTLIRIDSWVPDTVFFRYLGTARVLNQGFVKAQDEGCSAVRRKGSSRIVGCCFTPGAIIF